jgi:hypothetical protein
MHVARMEEKREEMQKKNFKKMGRLVKTMA